MQQVFPFFIIFSCRGRINRSRLYLAWIQLGIFWFRRLICYIHWQDNFTLLKQGFKYMDPYGDFKGNFICNFICWQATPVLFVKVFCPLGFCVYLLFGQGTTIATGFGFRKKSGSLHLLAEVTSIKQGLNYLNIQGDFKENCIYFIISSFIITRFGCIDSYVYVLIFAKGWLFGPSSCSGHKNVMMMTPCVTLEHPIWGIGQKQGKTNYFILLHNSLEGRLRSGPDISSSYKSRITPI